MKKGFTLIELLIVVAVLGIMATLAVPNLAGTAESGKAGEGVQVLVALRGAQIRYCLENPCGAGVYPTDCGVYDITIPALKHFDAPACSAEGYLSVNRNSAGPSYVLAYEQGTGYHCWYNTTHCPRIQKLMP